MTRCEKETGFKPSAVMSQFRTKAAARAHTLELMGVMRKAGMIGVWHALNMSLKALNLKASP